ncbi:hypothetical protein [Paracoccus litorisediminis]|uniref:Uncharacterized protein n=1 Tax=Paracoccus litorisediminis TaxID=2006130 RepID=A0A844HT64_9RHOB|nr:hypothetical protein [Paracoccus litorisediminis]MTH61517.1 hypothetical protein [Paracoccus litorisediminis]
MIARYFPAVVLTLTVLSAPAIAGFKTWTAEVEDDPFSGNSQVTVEYAMSVRSGVLVMCSGLSMHIKVVPGYEYTGKQPMQGELKIAVDGSVLEFTDDPVLSAGSVGQNLNAIEAVFDFENARLVAKAFSGAKKQIAIKDTMSDQPILLKATGSTVAFNSMLSKCLKDG